MRFDAGIDLLFHFGFVLSDPDSLTGKLPFARRVQLLVNQTKRMSMLFRFLKSDVQPRITRMSEENLNCLRSRLPGARFPRDGELAKFAGSRLKGSNQRMGYGVAVTGHSGSGPRHPPVGRVILHC